MNKYISDNYIDCNFQININKLIIKGHFKNISLFKNIVICAPNPPDIRTSYSGTALPFPNEEIAFHNTKNYYKINQGIIDVIFDIPNSYYSADGYNKIKTPIMLIIDDKKIIYELDDICPLKTIRDRVRGNPSFYAIKELVLPVATAEENMYNYANAKQYYNIA
jgi:hypothetical protein